jgi:hypothetical protein
LEVDEAIHLLCWDLFLLGQIKRISLTGSAMPSQKETHVNETLACTFIE